MTRPELLRELEVISNTPKGTLTGEEKLSQLTNWDSMTVVQFIALADEEFNVSVPSVKLIACTKVDDLIELVGTKLNS